MKSFPEFIRGALRSAPLILCGSHPAFAKLRRGEPKSEINFVPAFFKWRNIVAMLAVICGLGIANTQAATTYFSQGSVTPTTLANWNTVRLGSGTSPANFTAGDTFVIQNGHNMNNTIAWAVFGTGNKIQIENGGTLTEGALVSCTVFQIDNGGTYIVAYANGNAGNSADIPGSTAANRVFGASSTVEIQKWGDGTATPNALPSGISWGNLTINITTTMSGGWQQAGNITTINGNLSIKSLGSSTQRAFRFVSGSPSTLTVTIGGDVIVSGGILDLVSGACVGTFNVGGNFNQTAGTFDSSGNGVGTFNFTGGSASATFSQSGGTFTDTTINFAVANGKTLTLNNNFSIASSRTFTVNGTLNCGANNVTGAGAFTLASSATLGIGSVDGLSSTASTGNIQVTSTRTLPTTANYTYNGTSAQVTGNQLPAIVNNLTNNNSAGVTLGADVTVSGTLAITSGGFNLNNKTVTGTAAVAFGGTLKGVGTVTGVVTVNSGGTVAPGASIGTITFASSPTLSGTNLMEINRNSGSPLADKIVLSTGTLTYGGTLTVTNIGATLTGGEVFDLFDASAFAGSFGATNLPGLTSGLNWYTGSLTVDGTIIVNRAPTGGSHSVTTRTNLPVAISINKLKAGDSDADSDTLSITAAANALPSGASVSLGSTAITYTPSADFNGSGSFDYALSDGRGGTATVTVSVTIPDPTAGGQGGNSVFTGTSGNDFVARFAGVPGRTYTVEHATSATGPWSKKENKTAPADNSLGFGIGVFEVREDMIASPSGFYRTTYPSY